MKRHILMLIACVLPLFLLFLLPTLGVGTSGVSLLLLLAGCFALHLLMMKGFGKSRKQAGKGESHDAHRH